MIYSDKLLAPEILSILLFIQISNKLQEVDLKCLLSLFILFYGKIDLIEIFRNKEPLNRPFLIKGLRNKYYHINANTTIKYEEQLLDAYTITLDEFKSSSNDIACPKCNTIMEPGKIGSDYGYTCTTCNVDLLLAALVPVREDVIVN